MHNTNKLADDSYFKLLFQKVKNLGSDEIHITEFDTGNMEVLVNNNWSQIEQVLQTKEENIKIVL